MLCNYYLEMEPKIAPLHPSVHAESNKSNTQDSECHSESQHGRQYLRICSNAYGQKRQSDIITQMGCLLIRWNPWRLRLMLAVITVSF